MLSHSFFSFVRLISPFSFPFARPPVDVFISLPLHSSELNSWNNWLEMRYFYELLDVTVELVSTFERISFCVHFHMPELLLFSWLLGWLHFFALFIRHFRSFFVRSFTALPPMKPSKKKTFSKTVMVANKCAIEMLECVFIQMLADKTLLKKKQQTTYALQTKNQLKFKYCIPKFVNHNPFFVNFESIIALPVFFIWCSKQNNYSLPAHVWHSGSMFLLIVGYVIAVKQMEWKLAKVTNLRGDPSGVPMPKPLLSIFCPTFMVSHGFRTFV